MPPSSTVRLTSDLRKEYEALFKTCVIRESRHKEVDATTDRLARARDRYDDVSERTGVPWHVIAVIHCMETSVDFTRHLHNGDPLTARTKNVPANRPALGSPPFKWEESATDALQLKNLSAATDWSLSGTLFQLERFNGFGYRLRRTNVLTPYLWSFSHHYSAGKFIRDGEFSPTAVSRQCGAAVLLRRLAEKNVVEFGSQLEANEPLVQFSEKLPKDPTVAERVRELQRFLNTFPGIFLRVDGVPGPRTSDAHRKVTGRFLAGDLRGQA
jgi:lysozyme family protein